MRMSIESLRTRETFKTLIDSILKENREQYIAWGEALQRMPERGFCEEKSTAYVKEKLESMGQIQVEMLPVSGCIGVLKGGKPGPTIAILAELDAVYCPEHPLADPETGMAHVCGHHMQVAVLLALADAFSHPEIQLHLHGTIIFMAVPAEEMLPEELVERLQSEGRIVYASGKKELLRQGYFRGVDAVISTHAYTEGGAIPEKIFIQTSCNGFTTVKCRFLGKPAHTGECPQAGINALNAAVMCVNGLQAMRESFADGEGIRMSYILTEGGTNLSTVPDKSELLVQIRAKTPELLEHISSRVHAVAEHAAAMVGAQADIQISEGYEPYQSDPTLAARLEHSAEELGVSVVRSPHGCYCTDLGNVSSAVPTLHFSASGFVGQLHAPNFAVDVPETAYVLPARVIARTILDIAADGLPEG